MPTLRIHMPPPVGVPRRESFARYGGRAEGEYSAPGGLAKRCFGKTTGREDSDTRGGIVTTLRKDPASACQADQCQRNRPQPPVSQS
jgi:hypothetical protein